MRATACAAGSARPIAEEKRPIRACCAAARSYIVAASTRPIGARRPAASREA
jgi:hypothetical protein